MRGLAAKSPSVALLRPSSAMVTMFHFPVFWFARRVLPRLWMPENIIIKLRFINDPIHRVCKEVVEH